jgi:hypothetical protein
MLTDTVAFEFDQVKLPTPGTPPPLGQLLGTEKSFAPDVSDANLAPMLNPAPVAKLHQRELASVIVMSSDSPCGISVRLTATGRYVVAIAWVGTPVRSVPSPPAMSPTPLPAVMQPAMTAYSPSQVDKSACAESCSSQTT